MPRPLFRLTLLAAAISFPISAVGQLAPSVGYMFPPGGSAGSTVDVVLGGYDWTPDMDLIVRDAGIGLAVAGPPGPVIVPEPPYWFGKKARRSPFLMPRETPARLTLPPDIPPGIYRWQAANANGVTNAGRFVVSPGREIVENHDRREPQQLPALPITVSGQIRKIQEVDRFRFTAPLDGPVTCETVAMAIGSPLNAVVEVRDESGRLIADGADSVGHDLSITFAAAAGQNYIVSVYDLDFRGNRSFVYRLSIETGPRIMAAIPAAIERGTTREVEFVGFGLATGAAKLESINRSVTAPDSGSTLLIGQAEVQVQLHRPFPIPVSDVPESVESEESPTILTVPGAVTGVLDERYGVDQIRLSGKKDDIWSIELQAQDIGSPLDISLVIADAEGKELRRVDDLPGTTDPSLEFTVPADGTYRLSISDLSGHSGDRTAIYRLIVRRAEPGFDLAIPEFVAVPIDGTGQLVIKTQRHRGFTGPIRITVDGLPQGVSLPENPIIPEKKNDLKLALTATADCGTVAKLITVAGVATIDERSVMDKPEPVLLAVTMKPPFSIDAEGKDDVTKWPRGTTFPGPVLIERDESFSGDIVLEMSSRQGRHRQGIRGPELTVGPGIERILYPIFLPEWLETTRTSRMVVNGVARVEDPQGRIRFLLSKLKTRIGFLPTGALLKIECPLPELEVAVGESFEFPVRIFRDPEIDGPVHLELLPDADNVEFFISAQLTIKDESTTSAVLRITPTAAAAQPGERELVVRATAQRHGHPVVSETALLVVFTGIDAASR